MTPTLEVQRIHLDGSFLLGLSDVERRAFLISGQVVFELNVLNKLRVWSLGYSNDPSDLNRHATVMQSEYLARLLGGSIFEAWEALRKILHRKDGRHIVSGLAASAVDSHLRLKKLFGKGTSLNSVRNELAFHYDAQKLAESLEQTVKSDPDLMELILGGAVANNIPAASMYAAWLSLSRKYHSTDVRKGLEAFTNEVYEVLPNLVCLAEGIMVMLMERDLGKNWSIGARTETLENVPLISEVKLPFFSRPN